MGNLLTIFCCLFWLSASAATYYVDFTGGSDAANGTSTGTPWKHCPGDANATGTSSGTTLAAGDTVTFKGGVVYKGGISISQSGSSGNAITYDGNFAGSFGAGKAIIDGEGTARATGFAASASAKNYITINNFEIRNLMTNGTGIGVQFYVAGTETFTGESISNCFFHEIGYWTNDLASGAPDGTGVQINWAQNCTVLSNECTKCGSAGIRILGGGNGTVIRGNNVHDFTTWGMDLTVGGGQSLTNLLVINNYIHDLWEYDVAFWHGAAQVPHTDGIFLRGANDGSVLVHNNIIDGNTFYNDKLFAQSGGTAQLFFNEGYSNYFRNNVFINPANSALEFSYQTNTYVWNNTFYSPDGNCINMSVQTGPGSGGQPLGGNDQLVNNVFISGAFFGGVIAFTDLYAVTNLVCNGNLYFPAGYANLVSVGGGSSLSQWQAYGNFGFESNPGGAANGISTIGSLLFSSTNTYPTLCSTLNLLQQSGSPLNNAGVAIAGWNSPTDKNGVTRPQGSAWNIGAFEFLVGGPPVLSGGPISGGTIRTQ